MEEDFVSPTDDYLATFDVDEHTTVDNQAKLTNEIAVDGSQSDVLLDENVYDDVDAKVLLDDVDVKESVADIRSDIQSIIDNQESVADIKNNIQSIIGSYLRKEKEENIAIR